MIETGPKYISIYFRYGFFYFPQGKNAAYTQRRLEFKGGFYCFGSNPKEGEVEIKILRGKKYTASIIFSRKKCGFYSRAASIEERL